MFLKIMGLLFIFVVVVVTVVIVVFVFEIQPVHALHYMTLLSRMAQFITDKVFFYH